MDPVLKSKLNILIHLAKVDEDFDPKERAFIYNICLRHGVDLDLIGYLIEDPEPIEDLAKLSDETAIDYLTESILLIMVDGKILPSEVQFCLEIVERLRFGQTEVRALIDSLRDNLGISYDSLHKLVSKLKRAAP